MRNNMKFSFEGPQKDKRRLQQTGASEAGYPTYEWSDNWSDSEIKEFLARMGAVVRRIGDNDLTKAEQKALGDVSVAAMAGALAVASPNAEEAPSADPIRFELEQSDQLSVHAETVTNIPLRESSKHTEAVDSKMVDRFGNEVLEKVQWLESDAKAHFISALIHGSQPVVGHESMTRMEYVRDAVEFPDHPVWGSIPESSQEKIRELLQALPVQESGYHNGLVSSAGAVGLSQLMPGTILHMLGAERLPKKEQEKIIQDVQQSLEKQLEVVGKLFTNMHYTIFESDTYGIGEEARRELQQRHSGVMDKFDEEFVPLLLINAYNAGPARMGGVVKQYFAVEEHKRNGLTGRELFFDIIEWAYDSKEGMAAGFGEDARNYVPKIYAAMLLMRTRKNIPNTETYGQK